MALSAVPVWAGWFGIASVLPTGVNLRIANAPFCWWLMSSSPASTVRKGALMSVMVVTRMTM